MHPLIHTWKQSRLLLIGFLLLASFSRDMVAQEEHLFVLQQGKTDNQFELFCYPYPDDQTPLLHLTLQRLGRDLIRILPTDRKAEYRAFIEQQLGLFDSYLPGTQGMVPGRQYNLFVEMVRRRGAHLWRFDDLLFYYEIDPEEQITPAYCRRLIALEPATRQSPPSPETGSPSPPAAGSLPSPAGTSLSFSAKLVIAAIMLVLAVNTYFLFYLFSRARHTADVSRRTDANLERLLIAQAVEPIKKQMGELIRVLQAMNQKINQLHARPTEQSLLPEILDRLNLILTRLDELTLSRREPPGEEEWE